MHRLMKVLALTLAVAVASCRSPYKSDGERLAHTYCSACHAFPDPSLLDKKTWQTGVLPQMLERLSGREPEFSVAQSGGGTRSPYMTVLTKPVPQADRDRIVAFYLDHAPDSLSPQVLPAEPGLDPEVFRAGPFVPRLTSSAIITLLYADTAGRRVYVGEAATNLLRVFGWDRRLITTLQLSSPPTGIIVDGKRVLVLETGMLEPNDEPRGTLAQYNVAPDGALHFVHTIIDSLFRPVFVREFDADGDGRNDFLVSEFGDNRGRLALYRSTGTGGGYERRVVDPTPGAIRFELHDLTGDGRPDIVALFGQGDERIVLYPNDGTGRFSERSVLARFPPVYGSMYFTMRDFNGDGSLDILFVNGDNYDMSRVRKPFHGVRILENDGGGANTFTERFFFPVYGAAQAAVADFDGDGDLDFVLTSNFADPAFHPERSIMFFEGTGGPYAFHPYAFSVGAHSQWNLTATADFNGDGRLDVLVGAMRLENIARLQRGSGPPPTAERSEPLLLFENRGGRRE